MTQRRIEGIDALRGAAVALVMARHAAPDVVPGAGVVGVVMFFALSGHLITTVLQSELTRTGGIRFARFYRRRAERLIPALVAMMLGFTLVTLLLNPLEDRGLLARSWAVALTWSGNVPGRPESSDATFHLWTLAGEEQFYLLWPLALWWGYRHGRSGTVLLLGTGSALVGLILTRWWLGGGPGGADAAYVLPTSWVLAFLIGGASHRGARLGSLALRVAERPAAAWWAAGTLGLLCLMPLRERWATYVMVVPLVALMTVILIARARYAAPKPAGQNKHWLWRGLIALGTVSYGAYLWNYPLALWLRPYGGWGAVAAVLLTVAAAAASWRWIERPQAVPLAGISRPRRAKVEP